MGCRGAACCAPACPGVQNDLQNRFEFISGIYQRNQTETETTADRTMRTELTTPFKQPSTYPSPYPFPIPYKACLSFSAPYPHLPRAGSNPNTAYTISSPAASVLFSPAPRPDKEMAAHIPASQESHLHTGQLPRLHRLYSCSSAQPLYPYPPVVDPKPADPAHWKLPYLYSCHPVSSRKAVRPAALEQPRAAHLPAAMAERDCFQKDPAPAPRSAPPPACKPHSGHLQPTPPKFHLRIYGANQISHAPRRPSCSAGRLLLSPAAFSTPRCLPFSLIAGAKSPQRLQGNRRCSPARPAFGCGRLPERSPL
jgi:hypothetical protein